MATVTSLKTAVSTTDGFGPYSSGSYTPTAGLVQVLCVHFRGSENGTVSISNSDGITFSLIEEARWGTSIQRLRVYVADAVSNAVSQTTSWSITSDNASSSNIAVLECDGLADVSSAAVVQSAIVENGATSGTPEVVFDVTAAGTNPVLFVVGNAVNPAGITAPSTFTGLVNIGVDTPSTGLHVSGDDTGFSSDTVTAGSTSGGQYAAVAVEFLAASEAEAITGTAAQTLPSLTQASSGSETFSGTAGQTLAKLTQAAAGSVATDVTGTIAQTLPSLVSQGIGAVMNPAVAEQPVTPTGGWRSPPGFGRHETAEQRRRERERLGIIPRQQRAIDRTAVKLAAIAPQIARGGLLDAPAVIASEPFDRLLATLQPSEGAILALAQAILDRMAWITAEREVESEDEEALVRAMFELL